MMANGHSIKLSEIERQSFGKWVVLGCAFKARIGSGVRSRWLAVVECRCGVVGVVDLSTLQTGRSKECRKCSVTTHGLSKTPEYMAWTAMIHRCHNPKSKDYPRYGGRGIVVCDEWRNSFAQFLQDAGRRPSDGLQLDRINNNLGYQAGNVRWVTATINARNKRNTRRMEYQGEMLTVVEIATKAGIIPKVLRTRLNNGMDIETAIRTPVRQKKSKIMTRS